MWVRFPLSALQGNDLQWRHKAPSLDGIRDGPPIVPRRGRLATTPS